MCLLRFNSKLHKHRQLNYEFGLNDDQLLDAAWSGNDTRYINHAQDNMNIDAASKYINLLLSYFLYCYSYM